MVFVWPVVLEQACDGPEGGSDDLAWQHGPCHGSGAHICHTNLLFSLLFGEKERRTVTLFSKRCLPIGVNYDSS